MSHGAHHPDRNSNGDLFRLDGGEDGRSRKRLNRETPYYVRLNLEFFMQLESLLDVPGNQQAGTAVAGCFSRADLMEKGLGAFLQLEKIAREFGYRGVDELIVEMIQGFRFLHRQTAAPPWLTLESPPPASSRLMPPTADGGQP